MTETTVDVKRFGYQRNGIGGEGFYVALVDLTDYVEKLYGPISSRWTNLLVTFETSYDNEDREKGEKVDYSHCRVVDSYDLEEGFRGDNVAMDLDRELKRLLKQNRVKSFYDLVNLSRTGKLSTFRKEAA